METASDIIYEVKSSMQFPVKHSETRKAALRNFALTWMYFWSLCQMAYMYDVYIKFDLCSY